MKRWWRDWKRGWSDDDLESVLRKMRGPHNPNALIRVSRAEMRAHLAYTRSRGKKSVFSADLAVSVARAELFLDVLNGGKPPQRGAR